MQGETRVKGKPKYWLRRLIVLVLLLAIIGLMAWAMTALVRGRQQTAATGATVTTTPADGPRIVRAPATSPTPVPLATPGPPRACAPAKLAAAVAGAPEAKSGEKEELAFAVTNTGGKACILALTAQNTELVITSGNDMIWTSKDCWATVGDKQATVEPGKALEWKSIWETKRSVGSCELSPQKLGAGTYVATLKVEGVEPAHFRFNLI